MYIVYTCTTKETVIWLSFRTKTITKTKNDVRCLHGKKRTSNLHYLKTQNWQGIKPESIACRSIVLSLSYVPGPNNWLEDFKFILELKQNLFVDSTISAISQCLIFRQESLVELPLLFGNNFRKCRSFSLPELLGSQRVNMYTKKYLLGTHHFLIPSICMGY